MPVLFILEGHLRQEVLIDLSQVTLWPVQQLRHFDQLIKYLHETILDHSGIILIVDFTIPLIDPDNQEGILELVAEGVLSLFCYDISELTDGFGGECLQKLLVLLDGVVDELSDDVGEQSGVGLAEFFYVEFIAREGLDLLVVNLGHFLEELLVKDRFGLSDYGLLRGFELVDGNALVALLWQLEQAATGFELVLP